MQRQAQVVRHVQVVVTDPLDNQVVLLVKLVLCAILQKYHAVGVHTKINWVNRDARHARPEHTQFKTIQNVNHVHLDIFLNQVQSTVQLNA